MLQLIEEIRVLEAERVRGHLHDSMCKCCRTFAHMQEICPFAKWDRELNRCKHKRCELRIPHVKPFCTLLLGHPTRVAKGHLLDIAEDDRATVQEFDGDNMAM